jgi:hypothetical protein
VVAQIEEGLRAICTETYSRECQDSRGTRKLPVIGGPEAAMLAENWLQLCGAHEFIVNRRVQGTTKKSLLRVHISEDI